MTKLVRMAVLVAAAVFAGVGMTGCAGDANTRSTAQTFDDGTLTAKVKTALLADEGLKGNQVKVETYRGVVQLSGFVDNADQAQRAVAAAQRVEGVQSVKNDIRLKPGSTDATGSAAPAQSSPPANQ